MPDSIREPAVHEFDEKLLLRYSIQVINPGEPDYDGATMSEVELRTVSNHLDVCSSCKEKVEEFLIEYGEVDVYLEKAGFPDVLIEHPITAPAFSHDSRRASSSFLAKMRRLLPPAALKPITAVSIAAILVFFLAGKFLFGSDDRYVRLARVDQTEIADVTRSAKQAELAELLANRDLDTRIARLEGFIAQDNPGSRRQYAQYSLGVSYLAKAKVDFLGLFLSYDSKSVEKGIFYLESALNSGDQPTTENCHWFLAKGYLMKKDWSKARDLLEKVIELHGRKFFQAQKLLAELEEVAPLL